MLWGSNVPITRAPDAPFYTQVRYKGTKTINISPDYNDAAKLLSEPVNVIARIFEKLHEKENPYQHLLTAILELSERKPKHSTVEKIINSQKPMVLDEEYEEKPATFGGNN